MMREPLADELGMFDESQVYEAELMMLREQYLRRVELETTLRSVVI